MTNFTSLSRVFVSVLGLLLAIGFSSVASAQSNYADLTITNLTISHQTSSYTDFAITAQNQGNLSSPKSWIGIYTGSTFRRACPLPTLFPGQRTNTSCRFYNNTSADKTVSLQFFIDDMEEIRESNESNNTAFVNQRTGVISVSSTVQTNPTTIIPTPIALPVQVISSPVYTPVAQPVNIVNSVSTNFGENIGQYITCHFQNGGTGAKRCTKVAGSASAQLLFCTSDICRIKVYGPQGSNISFQGSCGGTQSATLDGYNKNLTYSCPINTYNTGTISTTTDSSSLPLLPIEKNRLLQISENSGNTSNTSTLFGDKYILSYNGATLSDDILYINKGDTLNLAITFEDIDDENLENYVYKRIPKNLRIVDVQFPESVECRTRVYSSFSTVFCRGQEAFTEIIYTLQAVSTGEADIYGKIRYTDDGDKILDTGYIPVIVK